jgi:hypothetical protein
MAERCWIWPRLLGPPDLPAYRQLLMRVLSEMSNVALSNNTNYGRKLQPLDQEALDHMLGIVCNGVVSGDRR